MSLHMTEGCKCKVTSGIPSFSWATSASKTEQVRNRHQRTLALKTRQLVEVPTHTNRNAFTIKELQRLKRFPKLFARRQRDKLFSGPQLHEV